MVYDTYDELVFMWFINQLITGGGPHCKIIDPWMDIPTVIQYTRMTTFFDGLPLYAGHLKLWSNHFGCFILTLYGDTQCCTRKYTHHYTQNYLIIIPIF